MKKIKKNYKKKKNIVFLMVIKSLKKPKNIGTGTKLSQ